MSKRERLAEVEHLLEVAVSGREYALLCHQWAALWREIDGS